MEKILNIIQIVIAGLLIIAILLQQRGTGLSGAFGGEGGVYFKKRGAEKIIFIATIILAVLFISAIARMQLNNGKFLQLLKDCFQDSFLASMAKNSQCS